MSLLKTLLANIAIALIFIALLVWGGMHALDTYTRHGESITVPDLRKMSVEEVAMQLKNKHLEFIIADSAYVGDLPPMVVLDQNPRPDSKVKENRKIYLTVNAETPPKVKMPDLKDKSLRQARMELETWGLIVGELEYIPDLAQNAVLQQKINGRAVSPGDLIPKGTTVDLVLGDGLGNTKVEVPRLVGLTLEEARFALLSSSLNVGAVVLNDDITDSLTAYVYKQRPSYKGNAKLNLGESVDIFLSQEMPDLLDTEIEGAIDSLYLMEQ